MLLRLASQYAYYLMLSIDCLHNHRSDRMSDDDFDRSIMFISFGLLSVCSWVSRHKNRKFGVVATILEIQICRINIYNKRKVIDNTYT